MNLKIILRSNKMIDTNIRIDGIAVIEPTPQTYKLNKIKQKGFTLTLPPTTWRLMRIQYGDVSDYIFQMFQGGWE